MSIESWLEATWWVFSASAPWLLIGLVAATLVSLAFPKRISFLTKPGLASVLRASAIGLPLPLCSCSVLPMAASIRQKGASRGATSGFAITTPEIGVDSLFISYALLGLPLTIARAAAAFLSALIAGSIIDWLYPSRLEVTTEIEQEVSGTRSVSRALHYGFVTLAGDLAKPLLIGILLAGLVAALFPPELLSNTGLPRTLEYLMVIVLALPLYVCASASTPLGATLIAKGLSPGVVLVFLLAGPAVNMATIFVLKKQIGLPSLAIHLSTIILVSLGFAYFIDSLAMDLSIPTILAQPPGTNLVKTISAIVLGSILLNALRHSKSPANCCN